MDDVIKKMNVSDNVQGSLKGLFMFRSIIQIGAKEKLSFEASVYKDRCEIASQFLKEAIKAGASDEVADVICKVFSITLSGGAATPSTAPTVAKPLQSQFETIDCVGGEISVLAKKGFVVGKLVK